MAPSELALLPAVRQLELIRSRQASAPELLEACLAKIAAHNDRLNAVCTLSETATDEAAAVQRQLDAGEDPGPLAGLLVGIKDVTQVAGLRTTFGSRLYADHVPDADALVVSRLRKAGAVIVGKTNAPEFAAGGNTFNEVFGVTRNPWNPELSAGGSTGGGAVGLATGMISLAEGTDLGGSLRIPASFCGAAGLRPSVGLVPTLPTDYLWDGLQVTGPMARTVADVALMLQAVVGPSPHAPTSGAQPRDFPAAVAGATARSLRLAYTPDIAGIGIEDAIESCCRAAALDPDGCRAEEVSLDLSEGRSAFVALRGHWMVCHHLKHLDRIDELGDNLAGNIRLGLEVTTRQLAEAEAARARIWEKLAKLLERFDALLTPCMAIPPFPADRNYPETIAGRPMQTYIDWIAPTFILSLTGLPVAAVPCGLDPAGLPVGLQVVGRPGDEETVLAAAQRIQEANPIGLPE